jgi:beta-glucosidase
MSGEAHCRTTLDLPGQQEALLKALHATGKPLVVVLMNGRPLSIPWLEANVPAIVEAWHLGVTAGTAITDLLFGEINPSGKLPISFPRTVGQVPLYYNHRSSGRPPGGGSDLFVSYLDQPITPLYPFGHGLSYTRFEYSKLALSSKKISAKGQLTLSVELKNTGDREGSETVQLYVQDPVASLARPVKELKGFQKVQLKAGESKKVSFTLRAQDLGFYDSAMRYVVEAGAFNVWVGGDSVSGLKAEFAVGK